MLFLSNAARRAGAVSVDWSLAFAGLVALGLASGAAIKSGFGGADAATGWNLSGVPILSEADSLVAAEDFASGAPGWQGGHFEDSALGFGGILGRFGGSNGVETVSKTYDLDTSRSHVLISFDLHAIDDWALEEVVFYMNGTAIARRSFTTRPEMMARQSLSLHAVDGVRVETSARPANRPDRGYASGTPGAEDQTVQVQVIAETPGETLRIGFGSTLSEDVDTASWAIDNLRVISTDAPPV
ncbi:hypothetical protein [Rhodophyticola sp.]|jgi:hypothetical protein|uniref:hypothetical protein n=1 Tax=Rhodophyticola sp. TaxID=2680032 RepID=UPI003D2DC9BB